MVYTYTKVINSDKLKLEIEFLNPQYIETVGETVNIYFVEPLGDSAALDIILANHDPMSLPTELIPDVTPRQIKQALVLSGVSEEMILAALATLPEPTKSLATIEWTESLAFQRQRPLVIEVGSMLGWTEEDLNSLWIFAGTL